HDADGASGLPAGLAHHLGPALVIRGGSMREIQAHDIHPREKHALQRLGITRRRAERSDYLGASAHQASEETPSLNFGIRGPLSAIFPVLPRLTPGSTPAMVTPAALGNGTQGRPNPAWNGMGEHTCLPPRFARRTGSSTSAASELPSCSRRSVSSAAST